MDSLTWAVLVSIALSDFISLALVSAPAIVYALIVRITKKLDFKAIVENLGLTLGIRRYYTYAFAILSFLVLSGLLFHKLGLSISPPLKRFLGQPMTPVNLIQALSFGLVVTGFGEELLFRGLIGGMLGRRLSFWKANIAQAIFFIVPHLLILFDNPSYWPSVVVGPFLLGLILGWLRLRSGSIFPCWIIHGFGNVFSAILTMMG